VSSGKYRSHWPNSEEPDWRGHRMNHNRQAVCIFLAANTARPPQSWVQPSTGDRGRLWASVM
jgi:hypothetical protein